VGFHGSSKLLLVNLSTVIGVGISESFINCLMSLCVVFLVGDVCVNAGMGLIKGKTTGFISVACIHDLLGGRSSLGESCCWLNWCSSFVIGWWMGVLVFFTLIRCRWVFWLTSGSFVRSTWNWGMLWARSFIVGWWMGGMLLLGETVVLHGLGELVFVDFVITAGNSFPLFVDHSFGFGILLRVLLEFVDARHDLWLGEHSVFLTFVAHFDDMGSHFGGRWVSFLLGKLDSRGDCDKSSKFHI